MLTRGANPQQQMRGAPARPFHVCIQVLKSSLRVACAEAYLSRKSSILRTLFLIPNSGKAGMPFPGAAKCMGGASRDRGFRPLLANLCMYFRVVRPLFTLAIPRKTYLQSS